MSKTNEMAASRESILAAPVGEGMPFSLVLVPNWGGSVRVYALSSDELDEFNKETARRVRTRKKANPIKPRVRVRLLIATVRDLEGKLLFSTADEDQLASQPAAYHDRPWRAAAKLCGFDEEEDDDAGNS